MTHYLRRQGLPVAFAARDQAIGLFPGPVGARGELAALLAQNSTDRLDRVGEVVGEIGETDRGTDSA